jgi:hypothetical protein
MRKFNAAEYLGVSVQWPRSQQLRKAVLGAYVGNLSQFRCPAGIQGHAWIWSFLPLYWSGFNLRVCFVVMLQLSLAPSDEAYGVPIMQLFSDPLVLLGSDLRRCTPRTLLISVGLLCGSEPATAHFKCLRIRHGDCGNSIGHAVRRWERSSGLDTRARFRCSRLSGTRAGNALCEPSSWLTGVICPFHQRALPTEQKRGYQVQPKAESPEPRARILLPCRT